jgi:hypothetical protein
MSFYDNIRSVEEMAKARIVDRLENGGARWTQRAACFPGFEIAQQLGESETGSRTRR